MVPFKEEEVVLVRRRPELDSESDSYEVFSLVEAEAAEDGRDGKGGPKPPFTLARTLVSTADLASSWPGHRGFVVDRVPEYLRADTGTSTGTNPYPSRAVHVLVSTGSGTGRALQFYEAVLEPLLQDALGLVGENWDEKKGGGAKADGGRYNLVVTTDAQSVCRFAAHDLKPGDTVILLSGDGGFIDILNGDGAQQTVGDSDEAARVPESAPLVALLPLGTGNALFHSLHKTLRAEMQASGGGEPSGLTQGLRTLFCTGAPAPLPSFVAQFSPGSKLITYKEKRDSDAEPSAKGQELEESDELLTSIRGAIVASYGFHSQLVWESDTPAYRRHGAKRFGMAAQELLGESHTYDAVVEIDEVVQKPSGSADGGVGAQTTSGIVTRVIPNKTHSYYVLATLVSNMERTFEISPDSRPLDGALRLVHFGTEGVSKGQGVMDIMTAAYDKGRHVRMPGVGYGEVARIKVTIREPDPRWRKVCIDGTIVEIPQDGSMTVAVDRRTRVRVLVDRSIIA